MKHTKTALVRLAAIFAAAVVACDDGDSTGPGELGAEQGDATLSAISESEYEDLLSQVDTATACVTPGGSNPLTVCNLVVYSDDDATWTVFAQASTGVSTAWSAAELTWDNPNGVHATAITPPESTGSPWVQIVWDSPALSRPTAEPAQTRSVLQVGPDELTVALCEVTGTTGPPGVSDCMQGSS